MAVDGGSSAVSSSAISSSAVPSSAASSSDSDGRTSPTAAVSRDHSRDHSPNLTVAAVTGAMSAAVDALARVPRELDLYRSLGDDALLDLTRVAADEVRLAQLHVSLLAGEIARRSAPELGSDGLAQRTGHRTPDELVRVTTGTRVADARTAVRVGTAMAAASDEAAGAGSALGANLGASLGAAVLDGRVSVAVGDAVRVGVG